MDTKNLGLSDEEAIARPYLASMGIYVFKYDRLEQLLKEDPAWVDFGREVIPGAIKYGKVQAFVFDGYWEDIGTISAFYRANMDLTAKIPKFNLFDAEAPVYTQGALSAPFQDSGVTDSRFDYERWLHHRWGQHIEFGNRLEKSSLKGSAARRVVHDGGRLLPDA